MATFQERLDDCFSKGTTKAKGDAFELLVQEYYRNDPKWEHIVNMWLWQEWPKHQQYGREMGVDLIIEDRNGGLIAVQAKGYGEQTPVDLVDVLKFDNFAKNNLHIHTKHLVTSGSISGPAQEVIDREHIKVIDCKQLESADIEWAETSGTKKGREAARLAEKARIKALEAARRKTAKRLEAARRKTAKRLERLKKYGATTLQEKEELRQGLVKNAYESLGEATTPQDSRLKQRQELAKITYEFLGRATTPEVKEELRQDLAKYAYESLGEDVKSQFLGMVTAELERIDHPEANYFIRSRMGSEEGEPEIFYAMLIDTINNRKAGKDMQQFFRQYPWILDIYAL